MASERDKSKSTDMFSMSCSKIQDISMSCDIDDNFVRRRKPLDSQASVQGDIKVLLHKAMKFRYASSKEISLSADPSISGAFDKNEGVLGNFWECQKNFIIEDSEEDSPDSINIVTMKDIEPSCA